MTAILYLFIGGISVLSTFLWVLSCLGNFQQNRVRAAAVGLTHILSPVYEVNLLYKLTLPLHQPIIEFLGLHRWSPYWRFFYMDWHFQTRHDQFKAWGTDLFIMTTPGRNVVTSASAEVCYQVATQGTEFPKPTYLYARANFLGENVITTEGNAWRRFRRITAPPFNEQLMRSVWVQSRKLCLELRDQWTASGSELGSVVPGITNLTMKVITAAGFGVHTSLAENHTSSNAGPEDNEYFTSIPKGFSAPFGAAISLLVKNVVAVCALPLGALMLSPWRSTGLAFVDTQKYLRALLHRERRREEEGYYSTRSLERRHNILSALNKPGDEKTPGMNEDEAIANAFGLVLAGHASSADTLNYSLVSLATFPEKQEWFLKKLDQALDGESEDPNDWNYETLFGKLAPCLCVMNETMRLFPPVPVIPKWTGDKTSSLVYEGEVYTLPPNTMVNIDLAGLQQNPKYWGTDAYEYRPELWDATELTGWTPETFGRTPDPSISAPFSNVRKPVKGSFMPMSMGHRACLGEKFAQVELCLILAILFQKSRLEVVCQKNESPEAARKRSWGVMRGSRSLISLQMQEDVAVRWVPR
ncbi:cytochrome P450 [Geopyxis carbonaria]|nr:cytochrome P450 [Geopyxis carbonaria]